MQREPNLLSSQRFMDKSRKPDIFSYALKVIGIIILIVIAGAAGIYIFSKENTYILNSVPNPKIISDVSSKISDILTGANKEEKKTEEKISLLSFGDVMLDREVRLRISRGGDPFSLIRGADGNFFRGIDFVSINLEGPITDNPNCPKGELLFQFDPAAAIKFLKENNINLANLANNHTANCGKAGIIDTEKYLSDANIGFFGSVDNRFTVKQAGGEKIAFMGISALFESGRMPEFYDLVKKLKTENNYVVVNIHWGNEYSKQFSASQENMAHSLIDNGADMIIGHHPHVVQPLEIYKNKPIFYSLGNFVFDQVMPETKKGLGVGAIFSKQKISLSLFPFEIKNYFQPVLLDYDKTKSFCDEFLKNFKQAEMCKIEIAQQFF